MKNSSTKPKGATSYKDTAFGIISRSKLLKFEIEGIKKGLEYISSIVGKDKYTSITPELIRKLHEVSFGWIFPQWAGKYRKIQVTFSDKEAPQYFQVPELMANLCKDLIERLKYLPSKAKEEYIIEVVTLLAWFQYRFVFIHPFQDYNGRTARMLTILILLKLNLPPIELKAEKEVDRKQYITAMRKADEGDYSLLEQLIGEALSETLLSSQM
ncbi:Fic family protein [Patescibacteria group bacterium]|nr:Fic family protein [Patescibacteria group bacterium]MBU4016205.1 Fic family protein [Patescibacteria group bacterium]MBU4098664.1 Fic family protein [Patescibacteria group bacterium]